MSTVTENATYVVGVKSNKVYKMFSDAGKALQAVQGFYRTLNFIQQHPDRADELIKESSDGHLYVEQSELSKYDLRSMDFFLEGKLDDIRGTINFKNIEGIPVEPLMMKTGRKAESFNDNFEIGPLFSILSYDYRNKQLDSVFS